MPVVGALSLARRAQHATRALVSTRALRRNSLGNNARRSFSRPGHVKSDHLPADEQQILMRKVAVDFDPHRLSALYYRQQRQDNGEPRTWHLSSSPNHKALKDIVDRRLELMALPDTSDTSDTSDTPGTSRKADDTTISLTCEDHAVLRSIGYTHHHVDYYANILSTKDSLFAARFLIATQAPPFFVYCDFLARQHIRPEALRLLLNNLPHWAPDTPFLADRLVFPVFERLSYHCRRVWPNATPLVASWLTHQLRLSDDRLLRFQHSEMQEEDCNFVSHLTSRFNHALRILSQPSHISPFKNIVFQEAAQAIILKHMADHTPALTIDRVGYRAVARVQLANKKTPSEREWARLKSPSWPPWKEDRTGMDARIGLDYGVSRAHQILIRMQEAGYPLNLWDHVAMIYAGWDTDNSPTIQKRVFLDDLPKRRYAQSIWIARIRTTRTAQQAWACFLAYQDENLPADHRIYHAMFEVLIQERKRVRLGPENIGHEVDDDDSDALYPGDTMEIGSPPSSAHQLTYIRADIPSVQQLYDHMREDGRHPSEDTLAMLLDSAETLAEGLVYLETGAEKHRAAIEALLHGSKHDQSLHVLPNHLFAAYIRLLCRFPHTPLDREVKLRWRYGTDKSNFDLRQPLARAIYLLVEQKRTHAPAWNCVFAALARRAAPTLASSWRSIHRRGEESLTTENELYDKIFSFNLARQVKLTMSENDLALDEDAFLCVCVIAEHAASAVHTVFEMHGSNPEFTPETTTSLVTHANSIFRDGHDWMKEQFWILTEGVKDSISTGLETQDYELKLPRLYTVPRPALLHAYIRALGMLRDYDGLQELVEWMRIHRKDLAKRSAMDRRGHVLMRRALIALRVFIEDRWEPSKPELDDREVPLCAPTKQVEEIKTLIESVEQWGGWPSDEEVEMYIEYGRGGG
ncbi:hypothetical protein E4T49_02317 [Aureobasidium sp. EXF-10728]|nr:hypothetical protein E4T49_02317 [Aureobasidium sp. EXF-10728]